MDELCTLEPEQLAAFLDGLLTAEAAASIEAHLAACEACRWVAAHSASNAPGTRRHR
jgi:anti-sigma factor RsiW